MTGYLDEACLEHLRHQSGRHQPVAFLLLNAHDITPIFSARSSQNYKQIRQTYAKAVPNTSRVAPSEYRGKGIKIFTAPETSPHGNVLVLGSPWY
jgi:hypothetical protein